MCLSDIAGKPLPVLMSSSMLCGCPLFWQWQHKPELSASREMGGLAVEVSRQLSPVCFRLFMFSKLYSDSTLPTRQHIYLCSKLNGEILSLLPAT